MTNKKTKTIEEKEEDKIFVCSPRTYGKHIESLLDFFQRGKNGENIVFVTPKGNFGSPKYIESLLKEERKRNKIKGKINELEFLIQEHRYESLFDQPVEDIIRYLRSRIRQLKKLTTKNVK